MLTNNVNKGTAFVISDRTTKNASKMMQEMIDWNGINPSLKLLDCTQLNILNIPVLLIVFLFVLYCIFLR